MAIQHFLIQNKEEEKKRCWCSGGGRHRSLPGAGNAIRQRLRGGRHCQAAPGTILSCFLLSFHTVVKNHVVTFSVF